MESTLNNDTLIVILGQLDDVSLNRFLQTNNFMNSLTDELFWQQRFNLKFSQLLKYKRLFTTWREFYIDSSEATYAVLSDFGNLFYSNIHDAFNAFIKQIFQDEVSISIDQVDELPDKITWKHDVIARLCIIFPNRKIDDDQTLLSVTPTGEVKVIDNLSLMPILGTGTFFCTSAWNDEIEDTQVMLYRLDEQFVNRLDGTNIRVIKLR